MMTAVLDPWTIEWWTGPASLVVATWTLAAVAAQWLRYDATVWKSLGGLFRRRVTIRQFITEAYWCDRCSLYWMTAPLIPLFGPVMWLAVNGGYLLLSANWPTLKPVTAPDVGPPGVPVQPTGLLNGHNWGLDHPVYREQPGDGA